MRFSLTNRSKFWVEVPGHPEKTKEFAYSNRTGAKTYRRDLRRQGFKGAVIGQYENRIYVRIRVKGFEDLLTTVGSYDEANTLVLKIESDRSREIVTTFKRAMSVTMYELVERYLAEEVPSHRGSKVESYTLRGMLADSRGELKAKLAAYKAAKARGEKAIRPKGRRKPREKLEWFHLPFGKVSTTHLEQFKKARLTQVKPGTVDRELDLLASVIIVAIETWKYKVEDSPLVGFRRPKYCNERTRRLQGDEFARLMAAAAEEDQRRSPEWAINSCLTDAREKSKAISSPSQRKRYLAAQRAACVAEFNGSFPTYPYFEAMLAFLVGAAPRRGEALALRWEHATVGTRPTVHFPETKNGHARTIDLCSQAADLISKLPRCDERVFPFGLDFFKSGWKRIATDASLYKVISPHTLRHEAISRMAESGIDLIRLAAQTGHRDVRMLARYVHLCRGGLCAELTAIFDRCAEESGYKKGQRRLGGKEGPKLREILADAPHPPSQPKIDLNEYFLATAANDAA
jgi:integrase